MKLKNKLKYFIIDKKYKYIEYLSEYISELVIKLSETTDDIDPSSDICKLEENIEFLMFLTPKINFLDKKRVLKIFIEETGKNYKEHKRIKSFYEYLAYLICGIKKNKNIIDAIEYLVGWEKDFPWLFRRKNDD